MDPSVHVDNGRTHTRRRRRRLGRLGRRRPDILRHGRLPRCLLLLRRFSAVRAGLSKPAPLGYLSLGAISRLSLGCLSLGYLSTASLLSLFCLSVSLSCISVSNLSAVSRPPLACLSATSRLGRAAARGGAGRLVGGRAVEGEALGDRLDVAKPRAHVGRPVGHEGLDEVLPGDALGLGLVHHLCFERGDRVERPGGVIENRHVDDGRVYGGDLGKEVGDRFRQLRRVDLAGHRGLGLLGRHEAPDRMDLRDPLARRLDVVHQHLHLLEHQHAPGGRQECEEE
mmetsp:Transcript_39892/g.125955  ORF Transcript_39892/g.125955 Transcript_39892/m.125955 type:complete len:283 (-) Transcript_39892:69-917(-)